MMKTNIALGVVFCASLCVAQTNDWENLAVNSINREPPRSAYDDLVPIPRGVRYAAGEVGVDALDRVEVRKASIAGAPAHVADEAYRLTVGVGGVVVEAQGEMGERHARTTLAQLRALAGGRPVPAAVVTDWPELRWRGFMPDTARNYLDVPSLKAVIDMMGRYKLNLLHWHLTENYAWRLESRRYPQMQSDEAFVLRHRGKFYTQDEFRDIVDYAYGRGVTVMPEFDVPGHAQALRLALGVDSMTAPGVAETVAGLFDELCSLVPPEKMPFIHVGGDEVWTRKTEGVSPETLRLWAETIARNGRTLVSWNPGEKYPVAGPRVDMMWGGYGVKSSGAPIFDANGMYIETMDPFEIICSAAFRRVNPWDVPAEQRLGAIFCAWHDGFTGLPYDNMLRNQQIMPACVLYGNAYWSGCLADRPDRTCRMPQPDDPDFARVVDLERRVVAQRDRVLTDLRHPFHFLRQSDLRWRISDGDGKLIAKDVPGATISPFKGRGSKCNFITNTTGVVVMETWVKSPRDQEVGAWIGFTNIDRDHGLIRASPLPKLGEWTRFGSSIEINGIPVPPPEWKRPGLTRGRNLKEVLKSWPWTLWELDEEPFTDQEYFMRPPTRIRLRKGWNHVKLTLPMTSPVTGWSSHQWVGTFIPVLGDSDHPREVPGLEYASEL